MGLLDYLDLPASSLRDLVANQPMFDQWADPSDPTKRVSGREMLRLNTILEPFVSDEDTWANFAAGVLAEEALDPINWLGGAGIMNRLLKSRKLAQLAQPTSHRALDVADRGAGSASAILDLMGGPPGASMERHGIAPGSTLSRAAKSMRGMTHEDYAVRAAMRAAARQAAGIGLGGYALTRPVTMPGREHEPHPDPMYNTPDINEAVGAEVMGYGM